MNITEVVTYTLPPQSRRKEELSICSVFFCLLVLLIHIIAEPVESYPRDSVPYFLALGLWRLSSFVVQGYFFISGVRLFLHPKKESAGIFWLGRVRRVVLPYIAVCLMFALYYLLTGTASVTPASFVRDLFTGQLCGHFYYVILICQFYLLMPLWQWMVRKTDIVTGLVTSLLLMLMCRVYVPEMVMFLTGQEFTGNSLLFTSYLFYFVAGAYCGTIYDRFRIFLERYRGRLLLTWGILGAVNWLFYWFRSRQIYWASWLDMFHVLYCIYAILACLSVGYLWKDKKIFASSLFRAADRWSYHVYLVHPLVIFAGNSLFSRLGISSITLRFGLRILLVYGSMLLLVRLFMKIPIKRKK